MSKLRSAILPLLREHPSGNLRSTERDRVWQLKGFKADINALRTQLLATALKCAEPLLLVYDEELDEPELEPEVVATTAGVFELNPDVSVDALRRWLEPGNWRIFSPAMPSSAMNLAIAKPRELTTFMDEHGLNLIIDSFHDDITWTVVLADDEPPVAGPASP